MVSEKARENRLRRMAERQGYVLRKPRRRDTRALDYGELWLVRFLAEDENGVRHAITDPEGTDDCWLGPFGLDELEEWLSADPEDRPGLTDRRNSGREWLREFLEQAKRGATQPERELRRAGREYVRDPHAHRDDFQRLVREVIALGLPRDAVSHVSGVPLEDIAALAGGDA